MTASMQIIKAVRLHPQLYDPNYSLEDRQAYWLKLSKKLKIDAKCLRTRWHILRGAYVRQLQNELEGKTDKFPVNLQYYFQEMEFLLPHIRLHLKTHEERNLSENFIEPEFIITENDLKVDTDACEFDFVELETDTTNVDNNEVILIDDGPEIINITEETVRQQLIDDLTKQDQEQTYEHGELREYFEQFPDKKCEKIDNIDNIKSNIKIIRVEEEQIVVDDTNISKLIIKKENSTPLKTKRSSSPEPFDNGKRIKRECRENDLQNDVDKSDKRCEDVIFGELVAATLKNMSLSKKRIKKKEIMNILFT